MDMEQPWERLRQHESEEVCSADNEVQSDRQHPMKFPLSSFPERWSRWFDIIDR